MLRKVILAAAVGLLAVSVAGNGLALERNKTLTRFTAGDRDPGPWGAQTYCTVGYYNYCAGWVYVWSGWSPSDVVGVEFNAEDCPGYGGPDECRTFAFAWIYIWDSYPTYGFTASAGCARQDVVHGHLGEITHLEPPHEWYPGWALVDLGGCHVGPNGIVIMHWDYGQYPSFPTDARPLNCNPGDGSPPCMTCPQPHHTYYYGSLATGNFSGSPFMAGVYFPSGNDWMLDVIWVCVGPTAVEPSSWGNIKSMYE
jgi:hypothetical protein